MGTQPDTAQRHMLICLLLIFKLLLLSAEHIGTKTAVQIRSHAQKFFNKLEKKKEAGQQPDKGRHSTVFMISTIL